jgi:hypothetical protein
LGDSEGDFDRIGINCDRRFLEKQLGKAPQNPSSILRPLTSAGLWSLFKLTLLACKTLKRHQSYYESQKNEIALWVMVECSVILVEVSNGNVSDKGLDHVVFERK